MFILGNWNNRFTHDGTEFECSNVDISALFRYQGITVHQTLQTFKEKQMIFIFVLDLRYSYTANNGTYNTFKAYSTFAVHYALIALCWFFGPSTNWKGYNINDITHFIIPFSFSNLLFNLRIAICAQNHFAFTKSNKHKIVYEKN